MEIECSFEEYQYGGVRLYLCRVESCNITTPSQAVAMFKGKHKACKNNSHVTSMVFNDTRVHFIPRDLTEIFPNMSNLAIVNCGLKQLLASDMTGLEKLEKLIVTGNKVLSFPVDLFKNMTKLKYVDFSRNDIREFNVKILDPIRATVDKFNISDNPGVNDELKSSSQFRSFVKRLNPPEAIVSPRCLVQQQNEDTSEESAAAPKCFQNHFASSKYTDFTIRIQGKEYKVHKCVLASQSSVFDKMFSDDDDDDTATALKKIKSYSQAIFEGFLSYFYTNAVASEDHAVELFELAAEFDVPTLKLKCRDILIQTVNPQNALQIYNQALINSYPALKRAAFDGIRRKHSEIGEFLYEKPELVNAIIKAKNEYECGIN